MTKINVLLIFTVLFVSFTSIAQETTTSINGMRKNAISFNVLGSSPFIGITYERLVSENVSLEIGVGIPSVGAGIKYFPWSIEESKILFHIGLSGTYIDTQGFDAFKTTEQKEEKGVFIGYLPVGISYFGKNGFNLGVDVGPAIAATLGPYGNLKLDTDFNKFL
ncbi:hypothetical protein [Gillisia marina]|uniref:hypothetical protein n=1 Tax=Gillisia marina TaxID=1167637 RepID=UPI00029AA6C5|nr:hypothetical protein [Gillisia marina]